MSGDVPLRILQLIASVDPAHGGPVHGMLTTAAEMAREGHVTEVATLDAPEAPFLQGLPLKVHALGPGISRYRYSPAFTTWVTRHASKFDAAVVHGLWNHAAVGGWAGLRGAGTPYVVYPHGMMDPWFRQAYPLKHLAKQAYWWAFQGRVLCDAEAVLFTCEEERRLARGQFIGPSYSERVVAYGASDVPNDADAQVEAFRSAVPGLANRPYLLYLSRIHPKKGCDLLIEAFARVAGRYPDLQLVIAGPDQVGISAELQRQAENAGIGGRIHWPGMLQGRAKWGAFRGAEAFVLPSHQENFGIVVAEAMACGTPALITDQVNIWREVAAMGGGLVEKDDTAGITALLERFLALPPDTRAQMAKNARAAYASQFSITGAAADLTQVLLGISRRDRLSEKESVPA